MDNTALTPQEVADILKIAKNTVYELIKRGELNSYRVGNKVRVDMNDVTEYKNRSKTIKSPQSSQPQAYTPTQNIDFANALRINTLYMDDSIPAQLNTPSTIVLCGQDVMLDILAQHMEQKSRTTRIVRSYIGSYNSLYELYHGNTQIATSHLWDGDTDTYNLPYVRRMLAGIPVVIIHLCYREQGFYVKKGNPKKISSWTDLTRDDITFVNRERGSGTRVLLDEQLRKLGHSSALLKGYTRESTSHLTIASTVARGGADFGLGTSKVAMQVNGVEFIPLQREKYEMVIKKENINDKPFRDILDILHSESFKLELEGIGGYDIADLGKISAEL